MVYYLSKGYWVLWVRVQGFRVLGFLSGFLSGRSCCFDGSSADLRLSLLGLIGSLRFLGFLGGLGV